MGEGWKGRGGEGTATKEWLVIVVMQCVGAYRSLFGDNGGRAVTRKGRGGEGYREGKGRVEKRTTTMGWRSG